MTNEKYLHELHSDHKMWISELSLASDQLNSFQNRLQEVNAANTATEIRAQVEHFQNQFIRENEVIDILIHDINAEEQTIAANAQANNVATDHRKVADNADLRDRMATFNKIFTELKAEFTSFLAKTL
jgi:hypothetical protein